jgi:hypothetical protein
VWKPRIYHGVYDKIWWNMIEYHRKWQNLIAFPKIDNTWKHVLINTLSIGIHTKTSASKRNDNGFIPTWNACIYLFDMKHWISIHVAYSKMILVTHCYQPRRSTGHFAFTAEGWRKWPWDQLFNYIQSHWSIKNALIILQYNLVKQLWCFKILLASNSTANLRKYREYS